LEQQLKILSCMPGWTGFGGGDLLYDIYIGLCAIRTHKEHPHQRYAPRSLDSTSPRSHISQIISVNCHNFTDRFQIWPVHETESRQLWSWRLFSRDYLRIVKITVQRITIHVVFTHTCVCRNLCWKTYFSNNLHVSFMKKNSEMHCCNLILILFFLTGRVQHYKDQAMGMHGMLK
jgi:hypothetical protein